MNGPGTLTRLAELDAAEDGSSLGADASGTAPPVAVVTSLWVVEEPEVGPSFTSATGGRGVRLLRDRAVESGLLTFVAADESTLAVESDESAGAAHATPAPPVATPIPRATAKPPTRPT